MKSFIIKKDFIDTSILNKINDDVLSQLDIFLASGVKTRWTELWAFKRNHWQPCQDYFRGDTRKRLTRINS